MKEEIAALMKTHQVKGSQMNAALLLNIALHKMPVNLVYNQLLNSLSFASWNSNTQNYCLLQKVALRLLEISMK